MNVDYELARDAVNDDSGAWVLNQSEMESLANASKLTGTLATIAYPILRQSEMYEAPSEEGEGNPLTETLQFILDSVETSKKVSLTDLGLTVASLVQEGLVAVDYSVEDPNYLVTSFPLSDMGKEEDRAVH